MEISFKFRLYKVFISRMQIKKVSYKSFSISFAKYIICAIIRAWVYHHEETCNQICLNIHPYKAWKKDRLLLFLFCNIWKHIACLPSFYLLSASLDRHKYHEEFLWHALFSSISVYTTFTKATALIQSPLCFIDSLTLYNNLQKSGV